MAAAACGKSFVVCIGYVGSRRQQLRVPCNHSNVETVSFRLAAKRPWLIVQSLQQSDLLDGIEVAYNQMPIFTG